MPAVVDKYKPSKIETATDATTSLRRPFSMASRTASLPRGYAVSTVTSLVREWIVVHFESQLQRTLCTGPPGRGASVIPQAVSRP